MNCMEKVSTPNAMDVPDHNGVPYSSPRSSVSEHARSRMLQRHHTIQTSDDAYVCISLVLHGGLYTCIFLKEQFGNKRDFLREY